MKLKHKALLFNFIGFAINFIIIRTVLIYYIPINEVILVVIAAIVANILTPKFAVARIQGKEKLMMKWVLKKGVKEF